MSDTDKPAAPPRKPRKRPAKTPGARTTDPGGHRDGATGEASGQDGPGKDASGRSRVGDDPTTSALPDAAPAVAGLDAPASPTADTPASRTGAAGRRGQVAGRDTGARATGSARRKATATAPQPAAADHASRSRAEPVGGLIRVPMPVRWRDLDAFNHVNNSKYLSYLEEARLQWMLGVPGQGMDDHVAPVVAAAQLNYRRPITWPSQVVIELFVERLGNTSLTVGHRIVDAQNADTLFCDGHVVMVWIDRDSGQAAPLPPAVREACER